MAEFTHYEPGTPTWVDLGTKDVGGAVAFYSGLFGWTADDMGEDAGHYMMMRLRGKNVAGIGPLMNDMQPVAWCTYLASADADETARQVTAAGGMVAAEPFDVMDAGRMAVFVDPTGAVVLTWQANQHKGAELANEDNTLIWNELQTTDIEAAKAFYKAAFGIDTEPFPGMDYSMLKVGDRVVGGMTGMDDHVPAGTPSHWNTIFAVADVDATVARAQELGGTVLSPPADMPGVGRFASIGDPHGATFSVMHGADEAAPAEG